ncbi:dihydrodipicolinate reductase C-terminal domain-containing protein [Actinokineospora pegani]|uniref:dihydrodipicolinate reductase C-terminal domain-containing protein n=1 Tax=Actinokineospora pegani TaxID=2654637 RepID=UPI0012E9C379|nr:dihydrodipicolinate reductase C-terminal domain-containing protein [Actinokineospora pegani]
MTAPTVPVAVCGVRGRMSDLVADAVQTTPGFDALGRLSTRRADGETAVDLSPVAGRAPVIVDFTGAGATAALLAALPGTGCPLVLGTSGLDADERALLAEVARRRAVVAAANFSLALLSVARFVRELAASTGPEWDAGVLDVHFAGKRDRPSGTAGMLAEQWGRPRGTATAPETASFRLGDAVSEHRVLAAGPGEHVEVLHRVADRRAFLPGVLLAVRFAAAAPPGLHTLEDVMEGTEPG